MAVPSSNIGLQQGIQGEFGGSNPTCISEYYRGGTYVPSSVAAVPSSGQIAFSDFRGTTKTFYGNLTTAASVAEGSSITVTLSGGTGIPDGTYYWSLGEFTGSASATDFAASSGSFSVANNTGSFNVSASVDSTYEGVGTFKVLLGLTSGFTTSIASTSSISLIDGSKILSHSISNATLYRVSGLSPSTVTLTTSNFTNGSVLYYSLVNGGVSTADFSSISGTTAVSGNSATIVLDPLTKVGAGLAQKTFNVEIRGEAGGAVLLTTSNLTLLASPGVSVGYTYSSVYEGQYNPLQYTITNAPDTFASPYRVKLVASGTAANSADLDTYLSPIYTTVRVFEGGTNVIYDAAVESAETLTLNLYWPENDATSRGSTTFTINNSSNYTLQMSKTGGTASGQPVTVTATLSTLTAKPTSQSVTIQSSSDNVTFTDLYTGRIDANATSWSSVVYSNSVTSILRPTIYFRSIIQYHTNRTATLSNTWV